ncbi:hypothetical protein BDR06DRAFT_616714 [Suillus hirtellus]|nr:hypothetical protein BDR06DRAFT_616714 [Suillus hirtellus]
MTTTVSSTRNVILYFVALYVCYSQRPKSIGYHTEIACRVLPPVAAFFSKYMTISCLLHYYINDNVDANRTRIHCRYLLIIVSDIRCTSALSYYSKTMRSCN